MVLIAAVMPFVALLVTALGAGSSGAIVSSYASSVLPRYALSSIILAVGVAVCATVIGVACAWQIERYRFPGSRWLSWALLLPMTMPAYVAAYALSDFTQFSGPVQSWLRATFGWSKGDYWFPEFASMPGAIAVFSFTLYPYVYLISRGTFASRGNELFEAARTLGLSASDAWRRAVLPMARPAIAGAALLVVMETLADFGTVTYFGVETFTVGIYRAWQNMGDLAAAAQLAIALLLCVIAIVWLERRARRRARYASVRAKRHASAIETHGASAWARTGICLLPIIVGFVLPSLLLLRLMLGDVAAIAWGRAFVWIQNTVIVGGAAALVALIVSLWLQAHSRLFASKSATAAERILSFAYAVPGAVLAIGILLPLAWIDNRLIDIAKASFDVNPGLILTGSVFALIYASALRFYGVASTNVAAAYAALPRTLDDSARVLGASPKRIFRDVHWPNLTRASTAAVVLLFIDTVKELPATLTLRPFNFDTLATTTYNLVKDERLSEAALPSLLIVLVSLPAVRWLARKT